MAGASSVAAGPAASSPGVVSPISSNGRGVLGLLGGEFRIVGVVKRKLAKSYDDGKRTSNTCVVATLGAEFFVKINSEHAALISEGSIVEVLGELNVYQDKISLKAGAVRVVESKS